MSDIEDILKEIQLDPHYQLDGDIDFDDEDDIDGLMDQLGEGHHEPAGVSHHSHHHHDDHDDHDSHHHHKPSHQSKAHHNAKGAPRSSTQANLDELESLVAELTSSGGDMEEHSGHHQHQRGHNKGHQSVSLSDQPTFDSSLDALLDDLGGIGERDSIPPTQNKRSNPQPAHNAHHHGNHGNHEFESDDFEGLLSDLTGAPSGGAQANRTKTNSGGQSQRPAGQSHEPKALPSSNKKQPMNSRDSAAYVDDLESLMGELIGPSSPPAKNNARSNSIANQTGGGNQASRTPTAQRGQSRVGLSTHQESEDIDDLMTELYSNNQNPRSASKTYQQPPPASKSTHQPAPAPAQRQPTKKPQTIPEADDLESLMADLVPTAANKGRQSIMSQQPKPPQNQNSEVSDLDDLMANLYPPNIHGKKPGQQQQKNQRMSSVSEGNNADFDDMINNFQTGYGMIEQQQPAPAPVSNRPQKGSSYVPNNPNNNSHAVYNPPNNNSHAVYNPPPSNYQNNTPAPRTNTNQMNNNKPSRAGPPSSKDLSDIMDDLNTPANNYTPVHIPQQPVARKPPEPKLAKGMCAGCRKYIASTQKIQAMGREYHPEHFQCSTCNRVIGNGNFFEKEGQPQCESCYQTVFCSKCAQCNQPITTHCVTALSQSWHPECFVCAKCHTPFNNASYFEKGGRPYCGNCAMDLNSQKCRGCNQPIRGNVINALGTWHPEHFNCQFQTCHQPLQGSPFYNVNGLPYCDLHYQSIR